jgi:hypothetical protein
MEHEQVRLVSRPTTLIRIGTMLLLAVATVACNGGGHGAGGGSGNGGSGNGAPLPTTVTTFVPFVAIRPISAGEFRYNDDARVTVNGQPAALEDLHHGEIAVIRGTRIYRDGQLDGTGIDSIDVHHQVIGPVESVDPDHARLSVMSQNVTVTGDTMVDDASVSAGGLATIQPGDTVAVSGFFTEYGGVVATRISRRAADSAVLLRGTVFASNPATFRFRVSEFDVYYGQADIDLRDFPEGVPKDGDRVMLRSEVAPVNYSLNADSVAFVPRTLGVAENTEVELAGAMTPYDDSSEIFDVGRFRVHVNCATGACGTHWQSLRDNALVWIIGTSDEYGDVQARYTGLVNEGSIALTAAVDAIEPGTRSLTLLGFRVQASVFTQFGDERAGGTTPKSVEDLQVGDIVTARGTYGGTPGLLVSSRIVRAPAQDPSLHTWRFQRSDPAIIVLGRSILTNVATMVDRCENPIDVQRLFSDKEQIDALSIGLQASPAGFLEATWVSIYNHDC